MVKWDLSPLEKEPTISLYVASVKRKADIIRMDTERNSSSMTTKQRAEEIMALCDALERILKGELL
jgi:hypothetical protein|tara:strand:+ start:403 stop:600 length:198 start_codon:yes stop_codon:yes gene_type:complete